MTKTNRIIIAVLAVSALFALTLTASLTRRTSTTTPSYDRGSEGEWPPPLVPLDEIVSGGPPRDGIPPIDRPKFTSVAEASAFVDEGTLGLLVTVGETSRFYPYNIMTWHEIVNDEIEGRPLTVTFCPLCATGIVFERNVGGRTLDFGTSGKLYQSNLVMYDRQTDSLWSQVLRKAIVGPFAGTELPVYPATVTSFAKATQAHPDLQVLSTETGHVRDYRRNPYQGYEESEDVYFPVSNHDARLPAKTLMYVLPIDGKYRVYRWEDLTSQRRIDDEIFGRQISIRLSEDDDVVATDAETGNRIVGFHVFWFSIVAVQPDVSLWVAK